MTSAMPEPDARDLGLTLHYAGFRPFPSVNEHGELVDIRMWRWFPDIVEFVTLGPSESVRGAPLGLSELSAPGALSGPSQ